jgi:hypothetical protein
MIFYLFSFASETKLQLHHDIVFLLFAMNVIPIVHCHLFLGSRLWWFQVCSEVAYFQVAPKNDSIRSTEINTGYHLDLCRNVFGEGVYPDVFMTNLYYGGTRIAASKIVFTNGSQDPWRHASKQKSSKYMPSYIIKCRNCGHGTDLRGCPQLPFRIEGDPSNCSSPAAVSTVRKQIASHISLWLSQCQEPTRAW